VLLWHCPCIRSESVHLHPCTQRRPRLLLFPDHQHWLARVSDLSCPEHVYDCS
jgi:hypothetical protein